MKGFLFIGDPHVSSKRPGRRIDDYVSAVLEKLEIAARIAAEHELVPIILGDLFHKADENDLTTLCRLIKALKSYTIKPIVVGGNHDKKESLLKEADALTLLGLTDLVEVIDGDCREVRQYDFNGTRVALWVAPYGAKVPTEIHSDADVVALMTHGDFAFAGSYPSAKPVSEIKGCNFVVNGHLHKTAPSIQAGSTYWHNPGNIEPLSVDCMDHVPAVWSWQAGEDFAQLTPHILPHNRDCFDLTGLMVPAVGTTEALRVVAPVGVSRFAELLSAKSKMEAPKSDDNSSFIEELKTALAQLKASNDVQTLLLTLAGAEPVVSTNEVQATIAA